MGVSCQVLETPVNRKEAFALPQRKWHLKKLFSLFFAKASHYTEIR
jgi:hypothetical protein